MHVATTHEHMLASYVRGAGSEQEYHHCRDLVRGGYSFLQRDLGQDRLTLLFGIGECIEPLPVERVMASAGITAFTRMDRLRL